MRSSKYRVVPLLIALAVAGAFAASCAPPEEDTTEEQNGAMTYSTDLAAVEGVETTASGSADVEVDGESGTFSVTVEDLSDINAAHIHVAEEPDGTGPPAVWLYPDTKEPQLKEGVTSGELASGTFEASDFVGPLEGMTMDDLLSAIDEGRAYVNVHTMTYPDGEISGFLE